MSKPRIAVLGFSLESVVKEYGALRDAIVMVAREVGGQISLAELQAVFDCIIKGIAYAVGEYSRQRDAELMRQANEHFAFVAHELRNPLASAMLALSLLTLPILASEAWKPQGDEAPDPEPRAEPARGTRPHARSPGARRVRRR